ncbi:hypothetical protein NP233_g11216 [Leucocoprinus birnbaumii]|uniref:Uncharacterized protein n=1 Tax=Leucocoprinus birnbaumii TaxID=56174 RepID=A0AAD5YLH2_9AGAR|nr:hypothetical protein NP233_g11216 [Leucocoprinus birnbaumii]
MHMGIRGQRNVLYMIRFCLRAPMPKGTKEGEREGESHHGAGAKVPSSSTSEIPTRRKWIAEHFDPLSPECSSPTTTHHKPQASSRTMTIQVFSPSLSFRQSSLQVRVALWLLQIPDSEVMTPFIRPSPTHHPRADVEEQVKGELGALLPHSSNNSARILECAYEYCKALRRIGWAKALHTGPFFKAQYSVARASHLQEPDTYCNRRRRLNINLSGRPLRPPWATNT